jgi:hypothetical protein
VSESPIPIFTARDGVEAHFVRGLLQQQGIPATVVGDTPIVSFRPMTRSGSPQVVVPAEHETAAGEVVALYRRGEHRALPQNEPSWKCPSCGEMIEPQFTDCWNCRTPKPGSDNADHEPALPETDVIDLDLPCAKCEYNLRGLAAGARCPECGSLVAPSLVARLDVAEPIERQALEQILQKAIEPLAPSAAAQVVAILLLEALSHGLRYPTAVRPEVEMQPGDERIWKQLSAHALCREVINFAATEIGSFDDLFTQLRQLNINTVRQLGHFLFALIAFGLIEPTELFGSDDFPDTPLERLFFE